MKINPAPYEWTARDKLLYFVILLPFLIGFFGSLYLIGTISIIWSVILVLLYIAVAVLQAACCIGCPYRGRYCPALFGIFLGNYLSTKLYAGRVHDPKFFEINASIAEVLVIVMALYAGYWLWTLQWWYALVLLLLLAVHMVGFLTLICPKCSYNQTCPAGKISCKLFARHLTR